MMRFRLEVICSLGIVGKTIVVDMAWGDLKGSR